MTVSGRTCLPIVKYVGSGTVILPSKSNDMVVSCSAEAVDRSANRSPTIIANEKLFFPCNLESFSKTVDKSPSRLPITTLVRS